MQTNTKAFTLVEMLVAMAISTIIIAATYASYDLVATQYKKNIDVAEMHTSGRAVMQMIERDVRMADFKYRDQDANVTYGPITAPLVIKDSGDKCCDEVTVIYDYYDEDSKKVERIRIRYWAESYSSNKGNRYRLYKQIDVLGRNNAILANPIIGSKDLLADFVEDLQFGNIINNSSLFAGSAGVKNVGILRSYDSVSKTWGKQETFKTKSGAAVGVLALAFGPDGLLYVGGYKNGTLRTYDPVSKKWGAPETLKNLSGRTMPITALEFGSDGLLYVGTSFKYIRTYDPVSKKWGIQEPFRTSRRPTSVDALAFGTDGLLYVGTHWTVDRGNLRTYNPVSNKSLYRSHWSRTLQRFTYKVGRDMAIWELAFCPDGLLWAGTYTGLIRSYSSVHQSFFGDDVIFKNMRGQNISVDALACGADGLLYAGSQSDGDIRTYNPATKTWSDAVYFRTNRGARLGVKELAIKTKRSGQESLVTINLTLRTRNEYGINREFKKKDYHAGNYNLDKTDKYKRDTFSSTVTARNMAL